MSSKKELWQKRRFPCSCKKKSHQRWIGMGANMNEMIVVNVFSFQSSFHRMCGSFAKKVISKNPLKCVYVGNPSLCLHIMFLLFLVCPPPLSTYISTAHNSETRRRRRDSLDFFLPLLAFIFRPDRQDTEKCYV